MDFKLASGYGSPGSDEYPTLNQEIMLPPIEEARFPFSLAGQ